MMKSLFPISLMALPVARGLASMPPLITTEQHLPLAKKAMTFIDDSPDPFHVVQTSADMLSAAGFQELDETVPYTGKLVPGGKYYFTRNKSTLVAFCVGKKYEPGNGFKVIGGHTDSPNLKVKPRSKRSSSGCTQIAVECYGGGLWHTWFDRDLGISGRVLVRNGDKIEQKLVKIDRPILRIPNLAIHLQTADERTAFTVNKEDHLSPILAMAAEKALSGEGEGQSDEGDEKENKKDKKPKDGWTEFQEPLLLQLLAEELKCEIADIADFELNLFDIQKASIGGVHSEFIHSARLDNLASCFLAVQALMEHSQELADDEDISLIALFDHEEVGSSSAVGAGSPIMGEAVEQVCMSTQISLL